MEARELSPDQAYRQRLERRVETIKADLDARGVRRAIRMPEVLARTGYKNRSTIHARIRAGTFPPGRKIGNMRSWTLDEIDGAMA
jgi:predicted DNA-binding transcriptional regulator AlpA